MHKQIQLSDSDVWQLLEIAKSRLGQDGMSAAVAIVDVHGELMGFFRSDGCPLPSINNAIHKAFTASRERTASANIGKASREDPFPITNFGDLRYTGWGGGVPIFHEDQLVGAIGVSGLPEAEDIGIAVECVREFRKI